MEQNIIKYICIEGNIGAGKSSIAQRLAQDLGAAFLPEEFEENPLLSLFYEKPEEFAFALEFSFLLDRFRQQKRWDETLKNRAVVSDYFFEKCLYFAELNLSQEDFSLFSSKFKALQSQVTQPDLLVFIKTGVKELQHNIRKRGRIYEQQMDEAYLQKLNDKYQEASIIKRNFKVLSFVLSSNDQPSYDRLYQQLRAFLLSPATEAHTEILL